MNSIMDFNFNDDVLNVNSIQSQKINSDIVPHTPCQSKVNKNPTCVQTSVVVANSSSSKKVQSTVKRRNRRTKKRKKNLYDQNKSKKWKNTKSKRNNSKTKKSTIVNLSKKVLSEAENTLLEKGLKFCPTRKVNPGDQRKELDKFHRSLRIKQFFDKNTDVTDPKQPTLQFLGQAFTDKDLEQKLKTKSGWIPPPGSSSLEGFITANEVALTNKDYNFDLRPNITKPEKKALKDLSRDIEITIKQADKGGATVILDTKDYVTEGNRQLNDRSTYEVTTQDLTDQINNKVNSKLDEMERNGEITHSLKESLKSEVPTTPCIYFLPKIHKGQIPPPGRPVVSANGCATEKISAFVDSFIKKLVPKMKSHVKDTNDFINKIETEVEINMDSIMGTLDVGALYTNIPNEEGVEVIRRKLTETRKPHLNPKTSSIIDLLELVLKNNNLEFNGKNFLQIQGTAMGTKLAPSYANLFMEDLEQKMLNSHHLQPTTWFRYIDDIFFTWDHGEEELRYWLTFLNDYHQSIKFTMETSKTEVNFLDTKVKKGDKGLYIDLYTKPTDTNTYLLYSSAHPPATKRSLPYSQLLRLKRICTRQEDYERHKEVKLEEFRDRGYPEHLLQKCVKKVEQRVRAEMLNRKKKKKQETEDRNFLITTYAPQHNFANDIVVNNWGQLGTSKTTLKMYNTKLTKGFKRPKNLKDHLVRARTNYHPETIPEEPQDETLGRVEENRRTASEKTPIKNRNHCEKPNCLDCNRLDKTGVVTSNSTGHVHTAKWNVTCKSSNLVYCITCTKCRKQYVGQTYRDIHYRMGEHMGRANALVDKTRLGFPRRKRLINPNNRRKPDQSVVANHFKNCGNTGRPDFIPSSNMEFHILDFIERHPTSVRANELRLLIEYNWIHKLKSATPNGLNVMDSKFG